MRNFDLLAIPTTNHRLHVYLGSAKVEDGAEVMDHRFFIRAIIRHSDLITKVINSVLAYIISHQQLFFFSIWFRIGLQQLKDYRYG